MKEIFLSASVPVPGRGDFYQDADPFLIQNAVREFAIATLGRLRVIWGGHPAITPMIWSICEDLGVAYAESVLLYQSAFFSGSFPDEVTRFPNVVVTDSVPGDRNASLLAMREKMLSRPDLVGGVFIGGMEGILEEHDILLRHHPQAVVLPIASTGGAARVLGLRLSPSVDVDDFDYPRMIYSTLRLRHNMPRGPA